MKTRGNRTLRKKLPCTSSRTNSSPYFSKFERSESPRDDIHSSVSSASSESWRLIDKVPLHLIGNRYFDNQKRITLLQKVDTPKDFSISQAICSYGYFCLAPNRWVPASLLSTDSTNQSYERNLDINDDDGYLVRPLTYCDSQTPEIHESKIGGSVATKTALVAIGQDTRADCFRGKGSIVVALPSCVNPLHHRQLTVQIDRMLRLDVCLDAFHGLHDEARDRGFGRLYRSPTLFEDIVKTITNCNMKWGGTVEMNAKLCKHVGSDGAFPTPTEIYNVGAAYLKEHCRVGYRCEYIWNLSRDIVEGNLILSRDLDESLGREILERRLLKLDGVGPFAANNILQLMGIWDTHPYDTETVRLWKEEFGAPLSIQKAEVFRKAKEHYASYHPFSFTAYWFDLWKNYETRAGVRSPQWSIEQYESERPSGIESDHNVFFVNPSKAGLRKNVHRKKRKRKES